MEYCGGLKSSSEGDLYYDIRLDSNTIKMRVTDYRRSAWKGEFPTKDLIAFIKSQGPKASLTDAMKWLGESLEDGKDSKAEVSSSVRGLFITASFDYGRPYFMRLPPAGEIPLLGEEEAKEMMVQFASSSVMDKRRLAEELRRERQQSEAFVKKLERDLRSGKKDYDKLESELEQLKRESAAFLGRRQEKEEAPKKQSPFDLILAHISSIQAAKDQAMAAASAPAPAASSVSAPAPAPSTSAQVLAGQDAMGSPVVSRVNGSQSQGQGKDESMMNGATKKRAHETASSSLGPVVVMQGMAVNGRGKGARGGGGRPKLG
jgi:hypothetical protein